MNRLDILKLSNEKKNAYHATLQDNVKNEFHPYPFLTLRQLKVVAPKIARDIDKKVSQDSQMFSLMDEFTAEGTKLFWKSQEDPKNIFIENVKSLHFQATNYVKQLLKIA